MDRKIFKLLERKEDCVLVMKSLPDSDSHRVMYQVRDIENDIVYMGFDHNLAKKFFDSYDINKVRNEKKKIFEDWFDEYVEA